MILDSQYYITLYIVGLCVLMMRVVHRSVVDMRTRACVLADDVSPHAATRDEFNIIYDLIYVYPTLTLFNIRVVASCEPFRARNGMLTADAAVSCCLLAWLRPAAVRMPPHYDDWMGHQRPTRHDAPYQMTLRWRAGCDDVVRIDSNRLISAIISIKAPRERWLPTAACVQSRSICCVCACLCLYIQYARSGQKSSA